MCFAPQRRLTFSTLLRHLQPPKVVRTWCVLCILNWKCASRHHGVHFFDIATYKSGPTMVFCTFWLQNVLRATTACTFSTSQLPKVVRSSSVLSILTWKCASRHNGVHFFMSHLASWLRTRRFSEPTFRPSGATNHWKNTVNRDFPIFSRIYLFFLLIFSLLTLFTSAFRLSILSEVSLLNFLRLYYIAFYILYTIIIHWSHDSHNASQYFLGTLSLPAKIWWNLSWQHESKNAKPVQTSPVQWGTPVDDLDKYQITSAHRQWRCLSANILPVVSNGEVSYRVPGLLIHSHCAQIYIYNYLYIQRQNGDVE